MEAYQPDSLQLYQGIRRGPSPIGAARAAELLRFLITSSSKLYLDPATYARLRDCGLDAAQVDAAVEVLYAATLVDVRLIGDLAVVELRRGPAKHVESHVVASGERGGGDAG
jgi:hypothetical protein